MASIFGGVEKYFNSMTSKLEYHDFFLYAQAKILKKLISF